MALRVPAEDAGVGTPSLVTGDDGMSTVSPPVRQPRWTEGNLFGLLRATSRLKMFLETSSASCLASAALLGLALAAIVVDAAFALPPTGRIVVDLVILACALGALGVTFRYIIRNRFNPSRTARLVEERLNDTGSSFINAVDFATTDPRGASPVLRERAIRMAEDRSREISSLDVLPFRPLYKALGVAGVAGLVVLGFWWSAPRLFAMVLPRYLDPHGDHPPYTLVEFDIQITPDPVYHGRPAAIRVTLSGPETVDEAALVFVNGEETETIPMFRTGDDQFGIEFERAEQSRRFYIDTPQGRSRTMAFDVVEAPFFEDISVAYRYPEYTGWEPTEERLHQRGVRALVGTEVAFTLRSNLPLEFGRVRLYGEAGNDEALESVPPLEVRLSPDPSEPHTVSGPFPLEFSGHFELSLKAANGAESLETIEGALLAVPDRLPQVSIVQPPQHVVVVEDWQVPVTVEAIDDVGISRIRMYRSVNGWGPTSVELPFETVYGNAARSQTEFDLPTLGARAGDVITYYASAWDNHPSGTQFRDTDTYVIQVISKEDYQQYARQQYQMDEIISEFQAIREQLDRLQQQREEVLEELETLRKEMAEQSEPTPEMLQKMEELEEQLQQFSKSTEELAQRLQERTEQMQLYELEEPYNEMLQRLSKQLQRQSENASQASESLSQMRSQPGSPSSRQDFEQAAGQFEQENDPFNQETGEQLDAAEQDLEAYEMADDLVAAAERLKSIITRQRQVADRLQEFQNQGSLSTEDQARADRMAAEQELLEQELQEVVEEMQSAAERAQEKLPQMAESAMKICEAVSEMEIPEDQRAAARQARQGEGEQAQQSAESAAEKLESLQSECSNCNKAGQSLSNSLDGPLQLSPGQMQQFMNQLAQGRGIPGMQKPGTGHSPGQGMTGEGGTGFSGEGGQPVDGQGGNPQWRPGQSFPGSQAPLTIMGPHTMEGLTPEGGASRLGNDSRGNWLPFGNEENPGQAESLIQESRGLEPSAAGNLRGVPVGYRDAAEAYFQRLAEER